MVLVWSLLRDSNGAVTKKLTKENSTVATCLSVALARSQISDFARAQNGKDFNAHASVALRVL